jgi:D-glycero-alpha-D-manno-heptose-7-phosphate kinase
VCNVAIALHATVRVRRSNERAGGTVISVPREADSALAEAALRRAALTDVAVELRSDFPLGAGLGGSSAAGVAMTGAIAAWKGHTLDRSSIAEASRQLEVDDLGVAGGWQDHYAAAYGGALGLWFDGTTRLERIPLRADLRHALERQCLIVYTGRSRISGDNIVAVLDAYRARDRVVLNALDRMKRLAEEMVRSLSAGSIDDLAGLVGEHWQFQRSLHPSIPTPLIDEILARAKMAGALGGKALGASGGGCVLLIAPDERVARVRDAVAGHGEILPFTIDEGGFTWIAEE